MGPGQPPLWRLNASQPWAMPTLALGVNQVVAAGRAGAVPEARRLQRVMSSLPATSGFAEMSKSAVSEKAILGVSKRRPLP